MDGAEAAVYAAGREGGSDDISVAGGGGDGVREMGLVVE